MRRIQFQLTPAAGKQLIAQALVQMEEVARALSSGKILVISGTTNVFVANELLKTVGEAPKVTFEAFHRGVVTAPGHAPVKAQQIGDLLIENGKARFCEQEALAQICSELGNGDVIMKGANAVHLASHTAGILIGNTVSGGTIMEASRAVYSRRAKLILPVGLEKRVERPVHEIEQLVNDPQSEGLRFTAAPGEAFTELDAIRLLTGNDCEIIASGGVSGAEGCVWLQAWGGDLEHLSQILCQVRDTEKVFC